MARRWKEELWAAAAGAKALTDNLPGQPLGDRPPSWAYPAGAAWPNEQGRPSTTTSAAPKADNPKIITTAEGKRIGLPANPAPFAADPGKAAPYVWDNQGRPWVWSVNSSRWIAKFATGGMVKRPPWIAPSGGDVVPAMLTEGEGVVTTRGMASIGGEAGLAAINSGAGGGDVASAMSSLEGTIAMLFKAMVAAQSGSPAEMLAVLQSIEQNTRRLGDGPSARDVRGRVLEFA